MKLLLLSSFLIFTSVAHTQTSAKNEDLSAPKIFAPGIISDGFANRDMAISPDGQVLFYTMQQRNAMYGFYSVILQSQKTKNGWSAPEVAPFSGRYNDLEAAFSPDGKRLYFVSNRPLADTGAKKDYDIWYIEKKSAGWSAPVNIGAPLNTAKDEYYPSIAKSGNLYFTRDNGATKEDILVAKPAQNGFDSGVALSGVNSAGFDFNAFVDPDERFILFTSQRRSDDIGGGDMYVSVNKNGAWSAAINLGKAFNSTVIDYCPYVSPDKKYFFFTSSRSVIKFPFAEKMNAAELKKALTSAGNGADDIYYVNFKELEKILQKL